MQRTAPPFSYCPNCGIRLAQRPTRQDFRCQACAFRYYHNVAAAVAAFITCGDDLLVTVRALAPAAGTLDLPGGFVGQDETLEAALARELAEELAMHTLPSPRYLFSLPNRYPFANVEYATADVFFEIRCAARPSFAVGDDVAAAQWRPIASLVLEDFGLISVRAAVQRFQLDGAA